MRERGADWGMTVSDTDLQGFSTKRGHQTKMIGSSFPDADGSEGIEAC